MFALTDIGPIPPASEAIEDIGIRAVRLSLTNRRSLCRTKKIEYPIYEPYDSSPIQFAKVVSACWEALNVLFFCTNIQVRNRFAVNSFYAF